jgi:hypothetical protein
VWTDTFNQVISDLNNYRTTNFGGVEEFTQIESVIVQGNDGSSCPTYQSSYICLAKWTESLPTDGTHIEVIQSKTTAADSLTQTQALDDINLKEALIANQTQNVELKKTAEQNISATQANVQVVVTDTPTKTDVTVG